MINAEDWVLSNFFKREINLVNKIVVRKIKMSLTFKCFCVSKTKVKVETFFFQINFVVHLFTLFSRLTEKGDSLTEDTYKKLESRNETWVMWLHHTIHIMKCNWEDLMLLHICNNVNNRCR